MKNFENIGRLIRHSREGVEMSQSKLSECLGFKNGQFVSNIERGLCSIPADKVGAVSNMLHISRLEIVEAMVQDYKENVMRVAL